jgi:hypothetical protein
MSEVSLNTVVSRNAELVTADMGGETVMMSVESGKYFHLSKIGSAIWALMEAPLSVRELVEKLLDGYDVSREQCETETLSFLSDLLRAGIIVCGQV